MSSNTPRTPAPAPASHTHTLITEEFAALNCVKPRSVIVRLCNTGSFHGIRPIKLAGRRLLWPEVQVTAEQAQAAKQAEQQQEGGHHG